jgi:hypothetical protein
MTHLLCLALGFVAGIYRNEIADKARQLYIKITERP